ncbi:MAG TPA: thioredoxin family protein [Candidatus Desulfaltia sp.]|nr:thioredoxin family protein [Candidatus Desulfaltia sp.]
MKKPKSRNRLLGLLFFAVLSTVFIFDQSCRSQSEGREAKSPANQTAIGETRAPATQTAGGQSSVLVTTDLNLDFSKHKVTFIELGADRCIPCREMQPILKEIAQEYAGTVQVVFYDVWKDPRPARQYGIQLIPTQVFIDQGGKEIFRHVGYFAKEEILNMFKEKGLL